MDDGNKANQTGFTHHIKNSHSLRFLEKMKRLLVGLTYLKGERPSTHLGIDYIECVSVFPRFMFFFFIKKRILVLFSESCALFTEPTNFFFYQNFH